MKSFFQELLRVKKLALEEEQKAVDRDLITAALAHQTVGKNYWTNLVNLQKQVSFLTKLVETNDD